MTGAEIQGLPISDLAERFGTPLFVYDADVLREAYEGLRALLHPAADVYFSLKANPNVSVTALLGSLGAGAEVSSLVELETARWAGIPADRTIFLGPGKTAPELVACATAGLSATVCESLDEVEQLDHAAAAAGEAPVPVLLRVNPDFHTKGSGLSMGGKPRQFGIDADVVRSARERLSRLTHVDIRGVHAYVGTRFLDQADLVANTRRILGMAEGIAGDVGVPLRAVDVGGGFGIAYFDNEHDLDIAALTAELNAVFGEFAGKHPDCRIIVELGRYLTALCGTYVVRALYVKESMGERFVVADGGTNHHMPAVGVGNFVKRNFPIRSLTRHHEERTHEYSISGPLCTPSDLLAKRVRLPEVRTGDLIGVERSGAYGPTASPGLFLGHGHPAEVLVHDGVAHLVRDRDSSADLLAKQRLVPFITEPTSTTEPTSAGRPATA